MEGYGKWMSYEKGKGCLINVCRVREFIDVIWFRRWEKNVKKL